MKTILMVLLCLTMTTSLRADDLQEHYFDISYEQRTIPVKVYTRKGNDGHRPLIVYSHGLGGSRETKKYLLEYWAQSGFVCVSVQHPGSDESVWKSAPRFKKLTAMTKAASAKQFIHRANDIPAVLDQLELWNQEKGHSLYRTIDFAKVAMCGHSFGAITSQVMMGTIYNGGRASEEKRFKAFLLMSPSPVRGQKDQSKAFGHITAPVLCMTGTKDTSIIAPDTNYEERVRVYNALPNGDKHLYVFDEGKHNLFSGPTRFRKQLLDEHILIQELTLLFWQYYLNSDQKAKQSLEAFTPATNDIWKMK